MRVRVCACVHSQMHTCTPLCDFAAGTNDAEGDAESVADVAKQLERTLQTLEEKEREEDGEEGKSSPLTPPSSSILPSSSSSCAAVASVPNFQVLGEMQLVL